jgi:acetyltransferase-like isoleucine patch superfamily enzyme
MDDLGRQNVIGAGSVVVQRTDDFQVVVGNPARAVRHIAATRGI